MPTIRHTVALTSAALFALALSASAQSTAPPTASTAPPSTAEPAPSRVGVCATTPPNWPLPTGCPPWTEEQKRELQALGSQWRREQTSGASGTPTPTSAKPQCMNRYVTTTTDRFTGQTTMEAHSSITGYSAIGLSELSLYGKPSTPGAAERLGPKIYNLMAVARLVFVFAVTPKTYPMVASYVQCHGVHILADGSPVPLQWNGSEFSTVDVNPGGALFITARLTASAVAALGAAGKIEFKVCADEITASNEFVQAAHEFACKVAQ